MARCDCGCMEWSKGEKRPKDADGSSTQRTKEVKKAKKGGDQTRERR